MKKSFYKILTICSSVALINLVSCDDGSFDGFVPSSSSDSYSYSVAAESLYKNSDKSYSFLTENMERYTTTQYYDVQGGYLTELDFFNHEVSTYNKDTNRGSFYGSKRTVSYKDSEDGGLQAVYTYINRYEIEITDTYEVCLVKPLKEMDSKDNPVYAETPSLIEYSEFASSDSGHKSPLRICHFSPSNGGKVSYYEKCEYSSGQSYPKKRTVYLKDNLTASWNSGTLSVSGTEKPVEEKVAKFDSKNRLSQEYFRSSSYDSASNLQSRFATLNDFFYQENFDDYNLKHEYAFDEEVDYESLTTAQIEEKRGRLVTSNVIIYELFNGSYVKKSDSTMADGFTQQKTTYEYDVFTLPSGKKHIYVSRECLYGQKANDSDMDYNFALTAETKTNFYLSENGLVVWKDVIEKSDKREIDETTDSGSDDFTKRTVLY